MINLDKYIHVRLDQDDIDSINRRMKEAGMNNMSAYIRKIAIDGCIIQVNLGDEFEEVLRLTRIQANNTNQIAKRLNETDHIYSEDIKEIKNGQEKIWAALKEVLRKVSKMS